MKKKSKEILIYIRYLLPIIVSFAIIIMLFVPSYRFIFSGEVGDRMSTATLISNSWEQARNVLFGTSEQTDAAIIFSRTLFVLIIILVIALLLSLAVSIWTATVALRYFLSSDEDSAERARRVFCVFVPNRIILSFFSVLGLAISCLPYLMRPLYSFTYSQNVSVVLETPDSLIVGGVLVLALIVLSIISAPVEKALDADIFKKNIDDAESPEDVYGRSEEEEKVDIESKENIRRLFEEDKDKK